MMEQEWILRAAMTNYDNYIIISFNQQYKYNAKYAVCIVQKE